MKRLIIATLLLGSISPLPAQKSMKIPAVYKPVKTEMYKKGWIDFNKNGIKDIRRSDCPDRCTHRGPAQSDESERKDLPDGDSLRI